MPDATTPIPQGRGFPPPNPDGTPALIGPDEQTREIARRRAEKGHVVTVTGNYADIQRLGASLAANSTTKLAGVELGSPPGVDVTDDNVVSPAQSDALRGEYTVESAREGAVKPPEPLENLDAEGTPTPETNTTPAPGDAKADSGPPKAGAPTSATKKS